ncbi:cell wall metabolism sensor histidine kinase WalK [Synechococcus sp. HK01-R]|uniref:sensor histidine kinase n=1 Tax=Synechococcus sp. HK01-R TaxID=2751171 RepID=UPI001623F19F|nr:HAMP domain-containing sensor histidine kinase [Synechococcus sp. HK01-R]QNG27115.1 HAMP domain-containing histidine kinase [Synechococcus sp. HK01-R]
MADQSARRAWRTRLLGSIQGRLQLAAFSAVFLGFSFASSASIWLNYRNLIHQHHRHATRMSTLMMSCLAESAHEQGGLDQHDALMTPELAQPCLDEYSGSDFFFWIQNKNGSLFTAKSQVVDVPQALIQAADRVIGSQVSNGVDADHLKNEGYEAEVVNLGDEQFVVHQHEIAGMGSKVWTAENVTAAVMDDKNFFGLLVGVWGTILGLTALGVGLLVSRIVRPLLQLNSMADQVKADNLNRLRIELDDAPVELDQLAQAFNRVLDRLSDAWDHQRQFVDAVSHELRTPLTILSGYLKRALRRGDNLTDQQRKAIETAQEEAARITRMISDLLDLARSDNGRLAVSLDQICAMEVVQETSAVAQTSLSRRIKLGMPDQFKVCILANRDRLKQVLLNLLENAAKYSAPDSCITIELKLDGSMLLISVIDQGVGIPAEDLDKIFDRFYRSPNALDQQGSGLGLSVVQLLVEAMDGSIAVTSEVGAGTTFVLAFPTCVPIPLPVTE